MRGACQIQAGGKTVKRHQPLSRSGDGIRAMFMQIEYGIRMGPRRSFFNGLVN
jgi:hypothetical protein